MNVNLIWKGESRSPFLQKSIETRDSLKGYTRYVTVTKCRALYIYISYNKTDGTEFYKWQLDYIRLSQFNLAFYLSTKHKTFCLFNDKESRDECFTSTIYNTDIVTENKVSVHLMLGTMPRDKSIFQWSTGRLVMTKNNSHFLWLLNGAASQTKNIT